MTILRANADTVKKIMTGKMHALAFTILGLGAAYDPQNVGTGGGSESGIPDGGADFRMRLDSVALNYTPPQASPKKFWQENGKPGTYIEIKISDAFPILICNSNFECSIPDNKGGVLRNVLQSLGWTSAASPVDATVPAANNPHIN